ncbi:TetR/AcrR family transcriptional regulator [Microbacterium sp. No. 7]|uniref:TetR/AcrR family transcriptional regulator n=1 Tax=Microbacterium sp. No. 7 TaxID=1714373 RepID=UPI0006D27611|nr:TetR family transcriptional regulator [Microbacterium sp. No. 7]ALJ20845.1 hypothetical protein AOA12_13400 [Microbacterium sp. No. 7]
MTRAKRDPEGRRRAIIDAAAELVVDLGLNGVTHRKVAERAGVPLGSTTHYFASLDDLIVEALETLYRPFADMLAVLEHELRTTDDRPRAVARMLCEHLGDPARIGAETAFCIAHLQNPRMRSLTLNWYESLVALLGAHTDAAAARAVALYANGVVVQTIYEDASPGEDELAAAIARLMGDTAA